jgi:hypothetical protein
MSMIGYEHIFVLSGSQRDQNGPVAAGTLTINPPGTRHSVVSEAGCIRSGDLREAGKIRENFLETVRWTNRRRLAEVADHTLDTERGRIAGRASVWENQALSK